MIALFPALMGATAGIFIPLFNLPPITLQTIFVFMAGLVLGPKKGMISIIIYFTLGVIGLPIFSGFQGGLGIVFGGSGGFLIGFIFATIFIGISKNVKIINNEYGRYFVILTIATVIIYMFGGSYIAFISNTSLPIVLAGFGLYLIGDFLKILVVIHVYVRIRTHLTYEGAKI